MLLLMDDMDEDVIGAVSTPPELENDPFAKTGICFEMECCEG